MQHVQSDCSACNYTYTTMTVDTPVAADLPADHTPPHSPRRKLSLSSIPSGEYTIADVMYMYHWNYIHVYIY